MGQFQLCDLATSKRRLTSIDSPTGCVIGRNRRTSLLMPALRRRSTTSPATSFRGPGMPCTTSSIDPRCGGFTVSEKAPCPARPFETAGCVVLDKQGPTAASISPVVTPGLDQFGCGPGGRPQTTRPAWRIKEISRGERRVSTGVQLSQTKPSFGAREEVDSLFPTSLSIGRYHLGYCHDLSALDRTPR